MKISFIHFPFFFSCLLLPVATKALVAVPEKLAQEFQATKLKLQKDEVKQREILGNLYDIGKKMKKIVSDKADLEQDKLVVESTVRELAGKITQLDQKSKAQRALLHRRLSAIYRMGGQGLAQILFSTTSSSQLERNLKILGLIAKQDLDLIKDYSRSVNELQNRKRKFQIRWTHLQGVKEKIQNKEKGLLAENQLKNQILDKIRDSQDSKLSKLSNIKQKSLELAAMGDDSGLLDLLFRPSFSDQMGLLPKPIEGQMVQGFGLMKDEVHHLVLSHKGQFYSAPLGTVVKSVFSGRVAFSGDIAGFGKTLIVDHGDHYYSVYSHTRNPQVREGDEVQQLQTLAMSGRSGSGFGDGIYFEIRHFSEPADPKQWMKGSSL